MKIQNKKKRNHTDPEIPTDSKMYKTKKLQGTYNTILKPQKCKRNLKNEDLTEIHNEIAILESTNESMKINLEYYKNKTSANTRMLRQNKANLKHITKTN